MSEDALTPIVEEGRNCWRIERANKARMNVEAKAVGGELLGLERELDAGFAARKIDAQRLKALKRACTE